MDSEIYQNEETEKFYENGSLVYDKKNNYFRQMKVEYTEDNKSKSFAEVELDLKS